MKIVLYIFFLELSSSSMALFGKQKYEFLFLFRNSIKVERKKKKLHAFLEV